MIETVHMRWLKRQAYSSCLQAMQHFTNHRNEKTPDEIWLLEHDPVFTQGQNGKPEHILNAGNIPVIQTDRGGQITYHGPGQLMIYTLIDLKRKKLTVHAFVSLLQQTVIDVLREHAIDAYAKREAPGVYVIVHGYEHKICSIGLRVRRGCTYHGIAFNVAMDLEPFNRINPCGFANLKMTQWADLGGPQNTQVASQRLINYLLKNFRYTNANYDTEK